MSSDPCPTDSCLTAEVRRARFGPGLGPGPRRQARRVGRGLRRSRVGPEDCFCEAVRNNLRVPLTLEGPTRTMRGAPALTCGLSPHLVHQVHAVGHLFHLVN